MTDTIANIEVLPNTVTDIYAETGITVGTQIQVEMIGDGIAKLYSGATLASEPNNTTGYNNIYAREQKVNDSGDSGAFIWSRLGCTVNVSEF